MSFHQKNVMVTLASFLLILLFFVANIVFLVINNDFNRSNVIQIWTIVVISAVFATLIGIIFTHVILLFAKNQKNIKEIDDLVDERDLRIDREGTYLTYRITSISTFLAMLLFAAGQSSLVMFSLLILSGLISQIAGDIRRLYLYQRR